MSKPKSVDELYDADPGMAGEEHVVDFANVEMPSPVPAGWYRASVVSAEAGMAKSSGNTIINLRWKVEGGAHEGRSIFDILTFTEKSLPFTKATLTALGVSPTFRGTIQQIAEEILGRTCDILVYIEQPQQPEYPPRNRVRRVRPVNGADDDIWS